MIRGLVLVLMLVLVWGWVAQWMMRLDLSLMMKHWRIVPQRWVLREEAGIVHTLQEAALHRHSIHLAGAALVRC